MSEQISGFFTGELYVTKTVREDNVAVGEDAVVGVVLRTGNRTFLFRCGIGGGFKFEENEHLHTEDGRTVYYPYYNETVVEVNSPRVEQKKLELVAEDVSVRYQLTDELYIFSEIEATAYSPNYLVQDGTVYAIEDTLFVEGGQDYGEDSFLDLESAEGVLEVRNTVTGRSGTVKRDKLDDLIENEEPNGAIRVQNPETPNFVHSLKTEIRQDRR
jgi:hypothetical protein